IAVLHGAYYGEEFARLSQHPALQRQLVVISSIQDKLALLRAGRVNAILEDISVLQYWQQHHYADAQRYQPLLKVYQSPVYFGFSKTSLSAQQLTKLADAWQRLYQQGELSAIYQKYQINNYSELVPASVL
ncbi:MAG TPA: transporter substrate-binding domain-containing protein, partial [Rheinheimera sp.]|nr:transporter substrate-binding domain-containing protein [Rheinheimera sp.]